MNRYGFNIRTRTGQRVDNICIMAAHREDAERRLRQMYHHCEILSLNRESVRRGAPLDMEGVISVMSGEHAATLPNVARSLLRSK